MTTISKADNRKVIFSGIEEGHAIIAEHTAYLTPGYRVRKWDKSIVALTVEDLRKILALAEGEDGLLRECLTVLEAGQPPKGGRTDQLCDKLRALLPKQKKAEPLRFAADLNQEPPAGKSF